MALTRRTRKHLEGKTIDVHSHVGVSLKAYAAVEYPYAQTIEGLAYRQRSAAVDVNVVFPFTADLYFDPAKLLDGEMVPASRPISPTPYAVENRLLLREVFDYCPELSDRFLPFVCVDPARDVDGQSAELRRLASAYPVYGVKVNPVLCQSKAIELLGRGGALLDFAEERNIPLLFHASPVAEDEYSRAEDVFRVIEARPRLRFCLAHCVLFYKDFLRRADDAPNIWVDTAAMKIQVQLVSEWLGREIPRDAVIDADYSDHLAVMRTICEAFPHTMLWGSDSPAYSYICRRKQGEGMYREFRYKATYEDEVDALRTLPTDLRRKVAGTNTLDFLFGTEAG